MNPITTASKTSRSEQRAARRNYSGANPNMADLKQFGDHNLANHNQHVMKQLDDNALKSINI